MRLALLEMAQVADELTITRGFYACACNHIAKRIVTVILPFFPFVYACMIPYLCKHGKRPKLREVTRAKSCGFWRVLRSHL